ncbi:hypothetical protein D9619_011275 [Psilocybe cf. subviscida]|uniref:CCHC-type domain-containing protein n=1 Tax=Psilocybe cf. subviscida TaxID=2480587 RepID=A0A8H5BJX8_9AGAR|nr:hypothetical protein D9619_011275 [Psilocybe cf. subviscida]
MAPSGSNPSNPNINQTPDDAAWTALYNLISGLANSIKNLFTTTENLAKIADTNTQQISQLATHVSSSTPATGTHAPSDKAFKLKEPEPFTGDNKDVRRFLLEINDYLDTARITDTQDKIRVALSLIKGTDSKEWALNEREHINNKRLAITEAKDWNKTNPGNVKTIPDPAYATWTEWTTTFRERFSIFGTAREAIEAIHILEQGNRTAEEYDKIFMSYYERADFGEESGLAAYLRGLNRNLRNKLETTYPLPADNANGTACLRNWIKRANELDKQQRKASVTSGYKSNGSARQDNKPSFGNYAKDNRNYGGNSAKIDTKPAPEPKDPYAMDIDRNKRSRGELTCFHCQRKGHYARDCPDSDKPKVPPARGVRARALYADMNEEERQAFRKDLGF